MTAVGAPTAVLSVLRQAWRRLTSMRTALILLFLLALVAVPGSLLPQRPLNPAKVQAYLETHGSWGRFLDRIGAFDVFGSVWFTAIYLLLFISLVGCLVPRISVYARAVRAQPIKAPRNLARLAESASFLTELPPAEVAQLATQELRPRWRVAIRNPEQGGDSAVAERAGSLTLSAEKGYSREAGNLLFHISLLIALVLIALGRLNSYQGTVVLTEGKAACNTLVSYDSFKAGSWVDSADLPGFCFSVDKFTATYRADGTPSQFRADIHYQHSTGSDEIPGVITVNHPLRVAGDRVYLLNHGYSPIVTIKRPGQVARTMPAQDFLPEDGFLTSEGAIEDPAGDPGSTDDLGLSAIFAPSPSILGGVVTSVSPVVKDPVLAVLAYKGQLDNGQPHSVYSLDADQIAAGKLKQVAAANLRLGESMTLPDKTVVTFTGYKQWVSLQVSHDPTQAMLLVAAVAMVVGLLGSLAVRRRRVWLRVTDGTGGGPTLIEMGGLARNDSGNFSDEFSTLAERLRNALNAEPRPTVASVVEPVGAGKD